MISYINVVDNLRVYCPIAEVCFCQMLSSLLYFYITILVVVNKKEFVDVVKCIL